MDKPIRKQPAKKPINPPGIPITSVLDDIVISPPVLVHSNKTKRYMRIASENSMLLMDSDASMVAAA